LKHVNDQVEDFKRVRGGILFRKNIPRNTSGKLLRREMREWARKEVDTRE